MRQRRGYQERWQHLLRADSSAYIQVGSSGGAASSRRSTKAASQRTITRRCALPRKEKHLGYNYESEEHTDER
jgi:hypothetical protein